VAGEHESPKTASYFLFFECRACLWFWWKRRFCGISTSLDDVSTGF